MQAVKAVLLVALAAAAGATANPLGKVIELLDSLAAKISAEGEAETKAYEEFVAWCEDAAANKGFEIKTATTKKGELEAAIGKNAGNIEASTAKIEELTGTIAKDDADLKAASAERELERADFLANEKEMMETLDVLDRAITILSREAAKNPAALLQMNTAGMDSVLKALQVVVDAAAFSSADKQKLTALLQAHEGADEDEPGAPEAAAYKSKSGGIIDVLQDLKDKAEEQLSALRKAETDAAHKYDMVKQALEDSIKADTNDLEEEKKLLASTGEAKATAEGELATTVKDLADATSALETVNSDCIQAAGDHEATVKARAEELETIAKTKKILEETTSGAAEQTYSMIQVSMAPKVVTLVRGLARQYNLPALAQLASRIDATLKYGASAGEDPFAKVKTMITELIATLEEEAQAEATEKAYCDEQMKETKEKKDELEYELSKLAAKIDQAVSKTASLQESIKELEKELSALTKQQAEMDKIRQEENAAFVKSKAELEEGIEGVRKALSVLRDYYGAAPALLQKDSGAGSGIIAMLEVVESDFSKNLMSIETEEEDAAREYEVVTQQNKVTKALKEKDLESTTKETKSLDKQVAELTADRDSTDDELGAVLEYYDKLKARCIAKPESFEDRSRRREAEIAGLKEALAALSEEAALVQRRKRGSRGHFLGA